MEDINLYDLAFAFTRHPEVTDANVATGMCPDDTVLVEFTNGQVAVFNVQDGYPAVVLGTLYADADGIREHDPLESIHHDFEGEGDYGDGVGDLIAQCTGGVTTMDTVEFVKDRKWPNTDSRILEIPVAGLGNVAVQDWSMLDDDRFAGYLLPRTTAGPLLRFARTGRRPRDRLGRVHGRPVGGRQRHGAGGTGRLVRGNPRPRHHQSPLLGPRRRRISGRRAHHAEGRVMNGLELCDRLRPLRDAAADNAYMLGDERERGMYDGYGEVMRRCLELPQADVEDWIYGSTHAIWESEDADTEYARGRGIAMDCVIWSLGPTGRELREAIEKRLGGE